MNERALQTWAATRLHVWPDPYRLVSLPPGRLEAAAALVARAVGTFVGLVLERDEVSLAVPQPLWEASDLRSEATREAGPYRAITLDIDIDLEVTGYLAPAATLLAEAGVSIVPICAFLKDHLLVQEKDLQRALAVLGGLVVRCREGVLDSGNS